MAELDITAGFRITGSKMQFVELSLKSGNIRVRDLNEIFFNEKIDFLNDKETKINSILQSAFDELELQKNLSGIYVSFSLPQNLFFSLQTPFRESLLYSDLIEEFRWQLSLLYPFLDSNEMMIQYSTLSKNNFNEINTAYVTAIPRKVVNIFSEFCRNNNLLLRFMDSSHTASDKALLSNKDISAEELLLSAMIEEKNLSLIFYSFGEPVIFSSMEIKNASEIPSVLGEELDKFKLRDYLKNAFISGDEISASFIEKLSDRTGISFSMFNPFARLEVDPAILDNKFYLTKNSSFSPAVGISIRSL